MKNHLLLLFLMTTSLVLGQSERDVKACKTQICKVQESYQFAKQQLEIDSIEMAQKWLNYAKDNHVQKKKDSMDVYIDLLQSEIFYYMEMFQFGRTEAEKSLQIALKLNDSLLISESYFFKGINSFELKNYQEAEIALWNSRNFYPKKQNLNRFSIIVQTEHVYNNLAQTKLKLNQTDSALFYNNKAYYLAKLKNSPRGIPNSEQTFGEIYFQAEKMDSSRQYFTKSLNSSLKFKQMDIALVNYGFLMKTESQPSKVLEYYQNAKRLMKENQVNSFFRRFFYEMAQHRFQDLHMPENILEAQKEIIQIYSENRFSTNEQIQNISSQYVKNENKLLTAEAEKLRKQRDFTILAIISSLLCIGILILSIFFIKRRNSEFKKQEKIRFDSLIEGQEKERNRIARDLHDGLNGDLSAIKFRVLNLENDPENRTNIHQIGKMIDQACSQVRLISQDLMPASLEEFGLIDSLHQYCQKLNSAQKIDIEFHAYGDYQPLSKQNELIIYRIIQELVHNIIRHSQASQAFVQLNFHENEISITVEDNGIGFNTKENFDGIGLKNIESRINMLKGDIDIKSSSKGSLFYILLDLNKLTND
jgi:signal transduction histidine kinase